MSDCELPYQATKNDKKKIIKDWQELFPFLHTGNSKLLKKSLPLLMGIALQYDRMNQSYIPIFYITNLIVSSTSLNVCQRCLELPYATEFWISISDHDKLYKSASDWLMANFRVFLEDKPIHLSSLIQVFQKQIESAKYPNTQTIKDMVYINGYFSRFQESEIYINRAVDIIKTYSEFDAKSTFSIDNVTTLSEWETKIRNECSCPDLLHDRVSQRLTEAKFDKIPNVPLIVD